MQFETPLIRATLLKRYKRFLADVVLADGTEVTAHVANPGSMMGMADAGMTVWLEQNNDPKRKLKYSWKIAEIDGAMVGVDTALPNKIVGAALRDRAIPELTHENVQSEVKYDEKSRIDFLLSGQGKPDHYLEVKSVTLSRQKNLAEFPDSVTARGAKHMAALANMVSQGHAATVLFLIQRTDSTKFSIAADIDPNYAAALAAAQAAGVRVLCYDTRITTEHIRLGKPLGLVSGGISD